MESYLNKCSIPVEIYRYDPMAPDDLYDRFRGVLIAMTPEEIKAATGLRSVYVRKVLDALNNPHICQLNKIASLPGIGVKTLEKMFAFAQARILD
jgi:hypothetical protein